MRELHSELPGYQLAKAENTNSLFIQKSRNSKTNYARFNIGLVRNLQVLPHCKRVAGTT